MEFGEIATVQINDETTVESAQEQYFKFFKALAQKLGSKIPDEQIKKQARDAVSRMHGHLKCPDVGKKVNIMRCHVCNFGHMTECHSPYRCSDEKAKCSHYSGDPMEF